MPIVHLKPHTNCFLRDPEETALGKRIVENSITLIDELGFEQFTFKKLAEYINSTEASVYRYFENKHKLLMYLVAWYWTWLNFRLNIHLKNLESADQKLEMAIKVISESGSYDPDFAHIREEVLFRIVVNESMKTYFTKRVDADNQEGSFQAYKEVCQQLAQIFLELNAGFKFPYSLASTLLVTAHQQIFFAQHFPSITDISIKQNHGELEQFMNQLVFPVLKEEQ